MSSEAPATPTPPASEAGAGAGADGSDAVVQPAKIIDLITAHEGPFIAFEYFPPRSSDGVTNLKNRMEQMAKQKPLYADVTWGAGGTTSDLTLDLCVDAHKRFDLNMNMHLTCTNMPEEKIGAALEGAKAGGVRNICALRGDAPEGAEAWEAVDGGFSCALDLVKHIRAEYGDHFGVSVSGYPEGHPNVIKKVEEGRELTDSEKTRVVTMEDGQYVCSDEDYAKELAYLKEKVDAGADFVITQMFFEAALFLKFVEDCRAAGINAPIVPGIMVIQNYGGFCRMTKFCKSRVPAALQAELDAVKDDADAVRAAGVRIGTAMCKELLDGGVAGLHFYSLNLSKVTNSIIKNLGLAKDPEAVTL